MKTLACLMLMGVLTAQNLLPNTEGRSQLPQPKEPFELTYYDIIQDIRVNNPTGKIVVDFWIDENGRVENPVIRDTFNLDLNEVVLDKVRNSSYHPAIQNGRPVRVKYTLPIVFK